MTMSHENTKKMVIFDHLPKTAGTSLASWAQKKYGLQNVISIISEPHQKIIENYSDYKIICGHTYFEDREGLSEKCRYASIFRNPIDRVISWIYFALSHDTEDMAETKRDCIKFLNGCDDDLCYNVFSNITNSYMVHFCSIYGSIYDDDETRLRNSINAIDAYDLIGLYENIPVFLKSFTKLVGYSGSKTPFSRTNTTIKRPDVKDVPFSIIKSIKKRNELDIEIYNYVSDKIKSKSVNKIFSFLNRR